MLIIRIEREKALEHNNMSVRYTRISRFVTDFFDGLISSAIILSIDSRVELRLYTWSTLVLRIPKYTLPPPPNKIKSGVSALGFPGLRYHYDDHLIVGNITKLIEIRLSLTVLRCCCAYYNFFDLNLINVIF